MSPTRPSFSAGPPKYSPPPTWLPHALRPVWDLGQRPLLTHTPSRKTLLFLLLICGAVALGKQYLGLLSSPAWDVLLGVSAFFLLWLVIRTGGRVSLTAVGWVNFKRGALFGGVFAALVVLTTLIALSSSQLREVVRVQAPSEVPSSLWIFAALLLVPLGTVLFEEFLFRGVLLAWLRSRMSTFFAVLISSALFGLWHLPAVVFTSSAAGTGLSLPAQLLSTFLVTAAGGIIFALLRVTSHSLLAPIIAHVATNSVGFFALLLAWSSLPTVA